MGGGGVGWGVVKDEIRNFQNKLLDICAAWALREEDAPGQNWEMSQGHFLKVENLKDFSEGNFEVNEQIWTTQTLSSNTAAWHHSTGCWSLGLFHLEVPPLLLRNPKKLQILYCVASVTGARFDEFSFTAWVFLNILNLLALDIITLNMWQYFENVFDKSLQGTATILFWPCSIIPHYFKDLRKPSVFPFQWPLKLCKSLFSL